MWTVVRSHISHRDNELESEQTGDGVDVLSGTACGDSTGETCPAKPSAAAAVLRYRGNGAIRPIDG